MGQQIAVPEPTREKEPVLAPPDETKRTKRKRSDTPAHDRIERNEPQTRSWWTRAPFPGMPVVSEYVIRLCQVLKTPKTDDSPAPLSEAELEDVRTYCTNGTVTVQYKLRVALRPDAAADAVLMIAAGMWIDRRHLHIPIMERPIKGDLTATAVIEELLRTFSATLWYNVSEVACIGPDNWRTLHAAAYGKLTPHIDACHGDKFSDRGPVAHGESWPVYLNKPSVREPRCLTLIIQVDSSEDWSREFFESVLHDPFDITMRGRDPTWPDLFLLALCTLNYSDGYQVFLSHAGQHYALLPFQNVQAHVTKLGLVRKDECDKLDSPSMRATGVAGIYAGIYVTRQSEAFKVLQRRAFMIRDHILLQVSPVAEIRQSRPRETAVVTFDLRKNERRAMDWDACFKAMDITPTQGLVTCGSGLMIDTVVRGGVGRDISKLVFDCLRW